MAVYKILEKVYRETTVAVQSEEIAGMSAVEERQYIVDMAEYSRWDEQVVSTWIEEGV